MVGTGISLGGPEQAKSFDLFSVPSDYFKNPAPYFRLLRDHDPVHMNSDGSVLLTQYQDTKQVWRDLSGLVDKSEMFRKKFGEGPLLEHHTTTMLFRDPPDHDRMRAVVNPFFTQASIASLSGFVKDTVDGLLDDVADLGEFDFVKDFAFRLPIAVICHLFGVPQSDALKLQDMGRKILMALNPAVSDEMIAEGHQATKDFMEYLVPYVEAAKSERDIDPTKDLIRSMVSAQRNGGQISDAEMYHMCILVLNGGHETTTNLIAQSVNATLDNADLLAQIRGDDFDIPTAVEEFSRYVSPLQLQGRRTTREIVLASGNGVIPAGVEVVLCQASANRDDRVFEDPDSLRLDRKPNSHVSFGAGVHVCLGRPLARLEASVAIPAFLRRFKKIERNGPVEFAESVRFRVMKSLPVRVS